VHCKMWSLLRLVKVSNMPLLFFAGAKDLSIPYPPRRTLD
jgi:hypothetical protein